MPCLADVARCSRMLGAAVHSTTHMGWGPSWPRWNRGEAENLTQGTAISDTRACIVPQLCQFLKV